MAEIARDYPLAGKRLVLAQVGIEPAPPADRFILRGTAKELRKTADALDVALPVRPRTSASGDGVTVLWLGPDEWLAIVEPAGAGNIGNMDGVVEISHRNCAIIVSGQGAEAIICAGCPLDICVAAFPLGACARTVLGKAEIVLYRPAEDRFRLECWRSYSDYVWRFLGEAAKCA